MPRLRQDIALADCLHALGEEGWSGAVRIHQRKGSGTVYVADGRVVHAEYGSMTGESAYWQLAALQDVILELDDHEVTNRRSVLRRLPPNRFMGAARSVPAPTPEAADRAAPRSHPEPGAPAPQEERRNARASPSAARSAPRGTAALGASAARVERPRAHGPSSFAHRPHSRSAGRRRQDVILASLALAMGLGTGIAIGTGWGWIRQPAGGAAQTGQAPSASDAVRPQEPVPEVALVADSQPKHAETPSVPAGGAPEPPPVAAPPLPGALDGPRESAAAGGANRPAGAVPVESSELRGADDRAPELLDSPSLESPDRSSGLYPELVLRLLVDQDGRVARASIYGRRPNLEPFEQAALEAAQHYRFTPGRSAGREVPVWVNLSVRFR
jgi:TonB family protein